MWYTTPEAQSLLSRLTQYDLRIDATHGIGGRTFRWNPDTAAAAAIISDLSALREQAVAASPAQRCLAGRDLFRERAQSGADRFVHRGPVRGRGTVIAVWLCERMVRTGQRAHCHFGLARIVCLAVAGSGVMFRPAMNRKAQVVAEPTDDAALYGQRQVRLAREHFASLSPERRAQLQREWEA